MKSSVHIALLLGHFFCFSTLFAQIPENLPRWQETHVLAPGDSLIHLEHPFVWPGSDTVRLGKLLLTRGTDYVLQPGKATLVLKRPLPRKDTLLVIYRSVFLDLPVRYRYPGIRTVSETENTPNPSPQRSSERYPARQPISASPSGTNPSGFAGSLRRSGSLTRSLTIGSGGTLQLDSGLRLQVEGKLAQDVQVVAALSDQNTPIQPEGTSQKLQELDRVFVQLKAPSFSATLGDFQVRFHRGRYLRYQRKLQGAMVQVGQGAWQFRVSGAVSRGKFFTNRFRGEEGKQGPYQLRGERGETEIVIIAGTERVWVDGQLMTRGEDHDYVIEYATGQITFTQKRLITADSRIVVDFEYSDLHYPRNLYSATAEGSLWNGRLRVASLWVREADDAANPIEGKISEADREYLASIGNRVEAAYVDGARFVGPGKGEYVAVDSAGNRIYRFVGKGNGEYRVQFTFVGEGSGSYRYVGQGEYRYVGEGNGNYLPRRFLPLPQSHSLGALLLTLTPSRHFQFSSEWAVSLLDKNRFSPLGDRDNLGQALQLEMRISPLVLKTGRRSLGQFQMNARFRKQDSRFAPITRTNEVEYARRWDLPDSSSRGEMVTEFTALYEPVRHIRLKGEAGALNLAGGQLSSFRKLLQLQVNRSALPRLDYRWEEIARKDAGLGRHSRWTRQLGTLRYRIGRLEPQLRYEAEVKREQNLSGAPAGFRFADWRAGLGLDLFRPLQLTVLHTIRTHDSQEQEGWMRRSRAEDSRIQLQVKRWKSLDVSISYILRRRNYREPGKNRQTRLADGSLRFHPWKGALSTTWRMLITTTRVARTEEVFLKVDEGRGSYRYDPELNEYVPDPFGDTILRILNTGEYEPVQDLKIYGRFRLKPRQFPKKWYRRHSWLNGLKFFSLDGHLSFLQRSRQEEINLLPAFTGKFPADTALVLGNFLFRQDLYLFENVRSRSVRLRWLESRNINNRLTSGGRKSIRQELSIRYVDRLARKLGLEVELKRRRQDRLDGSLSRISRKIMSYSARAQLRYRTRPNMEGILEFLLGRDQDRIYRPPTTVRYWAIKPGFRAAIRQKGRLRAELEWTKVTAEPASRIIPYEMAEGRRTGLNFRWNLSLDYRISSQMTFLLTYLGRKDPVLDRVQHIGRMELKAYF